MTVSGGDRAGAPRSDTPPSRESLAEAQQHSSPSMIDIAGGVGAPARARSWLLSRLDSEPIGLTQGDVALIVSELVTNSVVHAHVTSSQRLRISIASLRDRFRLTVTDPGSDTEPCLCDGDAQAGGGFGLRLVDQLCVDWGTARGPPGTSQVWCDIPLAGE